MDCCSEASACQSYIRRIKAILSKNDWKHFKYHMSRVKDKVQKNQSTIERLLLNEPEHSMGDCCIDFKTKPKAGRDNIEYIRRMKSILNKEDWAIFKHDLNRAIAHFESDQLLIEHLRNNPEPCKQNNDPIQKDVLRCKHALTNETSNDAKIKQLMKENEVLAQRIREMKSRWKAVDVDKIFKLMDDAVSILATQSDYLHFN